MPKKSGLGKGLSALIPDAVMKDVDASHIKPIEEQTNVIEVKIIDIIPNPDQPRKLFDDDKIVELSKSIEEHGVIQPLILSTKKVDGKYILIAGERRLRGAMKAGLNKVPVIFKELDEQSRAEIAIIENIQREDLSAIDEGKAYKELISNYNYTHEELSQKMGKSRTYITNILRLTNLVPEVQNLISDNNLSQGHGRALVVIPEEYQMEVAEYILVNELSVRLTEELCKDFTIEKIRSTPKIIEEKEKKPLDKSVLEIKNILENHYGSEVTISGKDKGKITIKYTSIDDFERILKIMKL